MPARPRGGGADARDDARRAPSWVPCEKLRRKTSTPARDQRVEPRVGRRWRGPERGDDLRCGAWRFSLQSPPPCANSSPTPIERYLDGARPADRPDARRDPAEGRAPAADRDPRARRAAARARRRAGRRRVLEIGTAIGYSASGWRGAAGGGHARSRSSVDPDAGRHRARQLGRAGVDDRVNVIVGDASATCTRWPGRSISSSRTATSSYTRRCSTLVALLRPGGVLVTDNVLWNGEVVRGLRVAAAARSRGHGGHCGATTRASPRMSACSRRFSRWATGWRCRSGSD